MIVIIFGPHGSGKGTQAKMVADQYGLVRVSTGETFRESMGLKTELGKKVRQYLEGNVYVPDEIVNAIVGNKIIESKRKGFVFDGYPRSPVQVSYLEKILKDIGLSVDLVVNLTVEESELVKRLANRLLCSKCGVGYNLVTNPPKSDNVCDACGGRLVRRKDDTEEGIKSRMNEFKTKSKPLANYYKKEGKLVDVDGNRSPELVFKDIKQLLGKFV